MVIRAIVLLLLALGSACAFETRSVGPGDRGLGDAGLGSGTSDAGVDDGGLHTAQDGGDPDGGIEDPECTPGTERTACPGTSCHPVSLVCTSMEVSSRGICETCFADSNCAEPSHRCVIMNDGGKPYPDELTGFCLQLTNEEGADCVPPFTVTLDGRLSLSGGRVQSYCGIREDLATCDAVHAFHNAEVCPSGRDDECPGAGLCRAIVVPGNKTEYRCTYACIDARECSSQSINIDCAGYCGASPSSTTYPAF